MGPMKRSAALFFSQEDLQLARDNREREPISSALTLLDSQPEDALEMAQLKALTYLLNQDDASSRAAIEALQPQDFNIDESANLLAIKRLLGWLSVMSMLGEHPLWQAMETERFAEIGSASLRLNQSIDDSDMLRRFWLAAVTMATGILLDDDAQFDGAAAVYRRAVDQHIHPEGYIKGIVDVEGAELTYEAQLSATCALVLLAEMAEQVGVDLWTYNNRAVSTNTAATYSFYYYFFPERWRWEPDLTRERTVAAVRREGAFFEMVNRRNPLRGVEQLFAERRPLFSAYGGGLTTLTHGLAPPKRKRWRLW